ncbi:MAG: hypothetical protein KBT35_07270 [Firmicutes bacterium]|nr:hypothetical protein [Candidatus Colivicinus equi]
MIKYAIEKHASGFPSKVLARDGGAHILNLQLKEDTDNTWFIGKGAFVELDLYEEAAPTSFTGTVLGKAANGNYYVEVVSATNAFFVYQVPMIEEEYNNEFKKEGNFYNVGKVDSQGKAAGDVVRSYELKPMDIIEVSAKGFKTVPSADGVTVTLQAIPGKTYAKQLGE